MANININDNSLLILLIQCVLIAIIIINNV